MAMIERAHLAFLSTILVVSMGYLWSSMVKFEGDTSAGGNGIYLRNYVDFFKT
jgi:hypothetical protein